MTGSQGIEHADCFLITHHACSRSVLSRNRKVGTGYITRWCHLWIIGIVYLIRIVIHLEHHRSALCIDYAEIGFYPAGLCKCVKIVTEIIHRSTNFQCPVNGTSVSLTALLTVLHLYQIITLCIHQCKSRRIGTDPRLPLPVEILTVHHSNEVELLPTDKLYMILQEIRITVFPQQRASVGRSTSRHNGRSTGQGRKYQAPKPYQQENKILHIQKGNTICTPGKDKEVFNARKKKGMHISMHTLLFFN